MGYPRPLHTIIDAGPHQALVEDLPASVQDSNGPARLGLANGLDVPVVCQMLCFGLNGDLFRESALASSYASVFGYGLVICYTR